MTQPAGLPQHRRMTLEELAALDVASLSARENARYAVEAEEAIRAARTPSREHLRRLWRCIVLARDLETCEALLRGEPVPLSRLDEHALARTKRLRRDAA